MTSVSVFASITSQVHWLTSDRIRQKRSGNSGIQHLVHYTANQTGAWTEGGVLFDTMIRYWYYTGNASNNAAIIQGMNRQSGQNDFLPANYSRYMTNDNQQIWALAAMTAAELDFPQEPSKAPWITMAENVFDEQVRRWDSSSCAGGLRWLVSADELGWTTKNSEPNGAFFELSARLARYTNNHTYVDWAEKVWDIDTRDWAVYDSVSTLDHCKQHTGPMWTFNYGSYISGAAYMSNLEST